MLDLLLVPAAYVEDQPYSKMILTTHVLHRGFNMGAIVGIGASLATTTVYKLRNKPGLNATSTLPRTLLFAARGGMFGLGLGALALGGRMYSKSLIEWQDRSWRLLQHPTQNQTDHFSLIGAGIGIAAQAFVYQSRTPRALLGAAALGSSAAIVLMLVSRSVYVPK
jgi:hypothetical protein